MDPYEKLLSPHRMPRRSTRQHHGGGGPSGVDREGGESTGGQGGREAGNNEGNEDENEGRVTVLFLWFV